jgi:hypothetical protein
MADTVAHCPVCGYGLDFLPWLDEDSPSDEICPCCFTQFGLDDVKLNGRLIDEAFTSSKCEPRFIAYFARNGSRQVVRGEVSLMKNRRTGTRTNSSRMPAYWTKLYE